LDKHLAQRPWTLVLAAGLLGVFGCGDGAKHDQELLGELERLAFVPSGQVRKGVFLREEFTARAAAPLLVDRFEVTRGDLERAGLGTNEVQGEQQEPVGSETWPASLGYGEAVSFAGARGMRLPTPGEWLYIASGSLGHRYPWGYNSQESVANTLDLGMERPLAVGTFEAGRGPFGTYDQLGNVWEWTSGWVPGIGDPIGVGAGVDINAGGSSDGPYLSAMGGSYTARQRPLFVEGGIADVPLSFFAKTLTPEHRAQDVGARCVADAEAYLASIASALPKDKHSQKRLSALGQRWFATGESDLIALLEKLVTEHGTGTGLDALLSGARP
jgi:hypothetical protein